MIAFLATMGPAFVVTKVEEINGVELFTLATTDGRQIINKILKNALPRIDLVAVQLPESRA